MNVDKFNRLRSLGIPVPEMVKKGSDYPVNAVCGTCALHPQCEFLMEKQSIMFAPKKITHPYLYNPSFCGDNTDYSKTFVIADEISQHSLIVENSITKQDVNNLISKLWDKKIAIPPEIENFLRTAKRISSRSLNDIFSKDSRYGLNPTDKHFSQIECDYNFEYLRSIFTPEPKDIYQPDLVNHHIFDMLEILCGKMRVAVRSVRVDNKVEIVVTTANETYISNLKASGMVYMLDATIHPQFLKSILGIDRIAIIEKEIESVDNLEIVQIIPDVSVSASRAKDTDKYINAIVEKIKHVEDDNIGLIDYGKFQQDYKKLRPGKYPSSVTLG